MIRAKGKGSETSIMIVLGIEVRLKNTSLLSDCQETSLDKCIKDFTNKICIERTIFNMNMFLAWRQKENSSCYQKMSWGYDIGGQTQGQISKISQMIRQLSCRMGREIRPNG